MQACQLFLKETMGPCPMSRLISDQSYILANATIRINAGLSGQQLCKLQNQTLFSPSWFYFMLCEYLMIYSVWYAVRFKPTSNVMSQRFSSYFAIWICSRRGKHKRREYLENLSLHSYRIFVHKHPVTTSDYLLIRALEIAYPNNNAKATFMTDVIQFRTILKATGFSHWDRVTHIRQGIQTNYPRFR